MTERPYSSMRTHSDSIPLVWHTWDQDEFEGLKQEARRQMVGERRSVEVHNHIDTFECTEKCVIMIKGRGGAWIGVLEERERKRAEAEKRRQT